MEKNMTQKMNDLVENFNTEIEPILSEFKAYIKEIDTFNSEEENVFITFRYKDDLLELINILVARTRRCDIKKDFFSDTRKKQYHIGINHNGLGIVGYNNLEPLNKRSNNHSILLRDLLKDDEVFNDLLCGIKKSNQKELIKARKIFKKYGEITNPSFEKEIIFNYGDYKFKLEEWGNSMSIFYSKDDTYKGQRVHFDLNYDYKTMEMTINDFSILCEHILQNKFEIQAKIKQQLKDYKATFRRCLKESEEIKKILEPYKALEKL